MTPDLRRRAVSLARQSLGRGTGGRAVATLAMGTAVAQLVAVGAAPLIARLFAPEVYGIYGTWAAFLGPLGVVVTLSYEMAIIQVNTEKTALLLTSLAIRLTLSLSIGMLAVVLLWYWIAESPTILEGTQFVLPFAVAAVAITETLSLLHNRLGNYGLIAHSKVTAAISGACAQVVGGLFVPTPITMSAGRTLGIALGAIPLLRRVVRPIRSASREKDASIRAVAKAHSDYPKRLVPSGLMGTVAYSLPIFVIGSAGGARYAGYYALGMQIFGTASVLLSNSVAQVFRERAARSYRESGEFRSVTRKTLLYSVPAGGAVALAGCVLSAFLVTPIFGQQWSDAIPVLQIMAIASGFQIALTPTDYGSLIVERLTYELGWTVARLLLYGLTWASVIAFGLGPLLALSVLVAISAGLYLVDVLLVWRWSAPSH